jgi:hypothetical protein
MTERYLPRIKMVPPRRRDRHARGNRGASRTDSFPPRDERVRESALFFGLPNGYGIGDWCRTISARFALRHGIPMLVHVGMHYSPESDIGHCESSNLCGVPPIPIVDTAADPGFGGRQWVACRRTSRASSRGAHVNARG